jgi:hypothetical protein
MGDEKSSAVVRELYGYANAAADINGALKNEADKLGKALEAFAATCTEYNTHVEPQLAGELHGYVRRTAPTDEWVRQVGNEFAEADAKEAEEWGAPVPPSAAVLQAAEATTIGVAMARRTDFKKVRQGNLISIEIKSPQVRKLAFVGTRTTYTRYDWRAPIKQRRQIGRLVRSAAQDALWPKSSLNKTITRRAFLSRQLRKKHRWLKNVDPSRTVTHAARGLWFAQIGVAGAENWQRYQGEETDVRVAKTAAATAVDSAVAIGINVAATAAGTAAGGAIGAAIGGPIGAAILGRVGGIAGSMAGEWISNQVMESDVGEKVRDGIADAVGGLFD